MLGGGGYNFKSGGGAGSLRRKHLSKDREVRGVLVRMSRDACSRQKTALVCLRNTEACAHEQSQPWGRVTNFK